MCFSFLLLDLCIFFKVLVYNLLLSILLFFVHFGYLFLLFLYIYSFNSDNFPFAFPNPPGSPSFFHSGFHSDTGNSLRGNRSLDLVLVCICIFFLSNTTIMYKRFFLKKSFKMRFVLVSYISC